MYRSTLLRYLMVITCVLFSPKVLACEPEKEFSGEKIKKSTSYLNTVWHASSIPFKTCSTLLFLALGIGNIGEQNNAIAIGLCSLGLLQLISTSKSIAQVFDVKSLKRFIGHRHTKKIKDCLWIAGLPLFICFALPEAAKQLKAHSKELKELKAKDMVFEAIVGSFLTTFVAPFAFGSIIKSSERVFENEYQSDADLD